LKLKPADGAASDFFGFAVAISGNSGLIGNRLDDDNGTDSGSTYLFNVTSGTQITKLKPNDGAPGDYFGISVALSGSLALVGSHLDTDNGQDSGSAYLFNATTGQQIAKLKPEDGAAGDRFGFSVALSGNTALVGNYLDDDNGSDSGSAYLFNIHTGNQIAKLTPDDGAAGDNFGYAIALSGNSALIGSGLDDDNGEDSGSAYLFAQDLLTPDPVSGGTIAFTPVRTGFSITLDDIPSIANTGGPGSVIHVTGFSFTGPDAALFALPGYTDVTLTAGAFDTIAYDLMFLGSNRIGDYAATLTLFTDSGDVTYTVNASVIPEPTTLALLALMGWLSARRRG
jgi:WD40 repeat protein